MTTDALAQALFARLRSRIAPRHEGEAHRRIETLVAAHPEASFAQLSGRAAAALADLLAARPLTRTPSAHDAPPATTMSERAAWVRARRGADAPPELGDGLPIAWSEEIVSDDEVLALWRRRAEQGPREGEQLFVYVHVPFCRTRCAFCQFESIVEPAPSARERFVESIERASRALSDVIGRPRIDALTLGGGTPSELGAEELARVVRALDRAFRWDDDAYVSVEVNPDSASDDRIDTLVAAGVKRLSMGVQSMHAPTLRAVARGYQDRAMVSAAVRSIRRHPHVVLGLDLLAPLAEETAESFAEGARDALALAPDELVLYEYQPVLRGRSRTIARGSLAWSTARDTFVREATARGYALVAHTGSSIVARRRGLETPRVRYVQHPHTPTSIVGLGAFAESHVFGHGRYVALPEQGSYRLERNDLVLERARLVARRLAASAPIDEAMLARATGASLSTWRPEVVGFLEERGELVREEACLRPALHDRERAIDAAWSCLDPRTIEALSPHQVPLHPLWGRRLAPLELLVRTTRAASARAHEGVVRLDDLLLVEDEGALATLLCALTRIDLAQSLARAITEGLLDASMRWRSGEDARDLELTLRAPEGVPVGEPLARLLGVAPRAPWWASTELVLARDRNGPLHALRTPLRREAAITSRLAARLAIELDAVELLVSHDDRDASALVIRAAEHGERAIRTTAARLGVIASEAHDTGARAIELEIPFVSARPAPSRASGASAGTEPLRLRVEDAVLVERRSHRSSRRLPLL